VECEIVTCFGGFSIEKEGAPRKVEWNFLETWLEDKGRYSHIEHDVGISWKCGSFDKSLNASSLFLFCLNGEHMSGT
jgi:hypothetical protein